jgi:sulfonate transport system ATP-binding protein
MQVTMLEISALSKQFDGAPALAEVDFTVGDGEIVAILGTSGSGKSTLLRIAGGIEHASSGEVRLDGRPVTGPSPKLGFVFQEPRLMPWLKVHDNIAFGLGAVPKAERQALAAAALDRVGLAESAGAWPRQLSGGMAQRVAIARALVTRPSVLLLDEPFSALDAFTRLSLQQHLLEIWQEERPTMLFVTHDIDEALMLADRVIVLLGRPGRVRRDERIDLPRPRRRGDPRLARWRERLFDDLSGIGEDSGAPALRLAHVR